jgi:hypothetical protein
MDSRCYPGETDPAARTKGPAPSSPAAEQRLQRAGDAVPGLTCGLATVAGEAEDSGGGKEGEAGGEQAEVRTG